MIAGATVDCPVPLCHDVVVRGEFFSPLRRQTKRKEERRGEKEIFVSSKIKKIEAFCILHFASVSILPMQLFFMPKSLSLSKVHNLIDVVRTFDYLTAREEH